MEKQTSRSRFFEAKNRIQEVYKAAKDEKRGLTAEESAEVTQLRAEMDQATVEMSIESGERMASALDRLSPGKNNHQRNLEFARQVVEAAKNGTAIQLRTSNLIDNADAQPLVTLTLGDIIGPLEKGMILDKVGCHIQTGLDGDWLYPVIEAVEASVAGEAVSISDSDIDINSVQPTPRRVAISVPVTKQAVVMTNDRLRAVVIEQLRLAILRTLNKWMFQNTAIASGVKGLFVEPTTTMSCAAFTYADICALVGAVDGTGINPSNTAAFVMRNATKAALKATPRGNGDRMIIENDSIDGVPVYVTEYAPEDSVEFGYFSYALVGQFGDADLVVDPFSLAKSGKVQFTLNTYWDIKAARKQAFGILTAVGSSDSE